MHQVEAEEVEETSFRVPLSEIEDSCYLDLKLLLASNDQEVQGVI